MRVGEKGQVTIPKELRDALGLGAGSEVVFELQHDGEALVVRKVSTGPTRGHQLARRLRGQGDVEMTTDEIMSLTRDG